MPQHCDQLPTSPEEKLQAIRQRLLKGILYVFAGLGFPALAAGLLESLHLGLWTPACVYIGLYLPVLGAALFWRRLPFALVAWLLFGAMFGLAAYTLFNVGLSGAGFHLLLTLCALSAVLLGIRAGFWIMGLSLIAIAAAGFGLSSGLVALEPGFAGNSSSFFSWAAAGGTFLLLGGVLVLTPGILQGRLQYWLDVATKNEGRLLETNERLKQEIHEREKAEKTLRDSEERLKVLFEYAPDGYYLNDPNGVLLDANHMAEKLSGYSRAQLVGANLLEAKLLSPDDLPRALSILEENRQGRATGPNALTLLRKDGRPVSIEVRTYPVTLDNAIVILGIARDITERKEAEAKRVRLEAQLHHAQRMEAIGTLAGGIAHDFNNILGVILGHSDLALAELPPGSPARESLGEIRNASLRARDLVRQILLTARKQEQAPAVIRLEPILKESLKMLRASIPAGIEIRQHIETELPPVLADPSQIQQIIINLCTNAAQAMETGDGLLTVSLDKRDTMDTGELKNSAAMPGEALPEGPWLRLQVSDTGPGIPSQIRERIFEPYYTTKGVGEGSGLGLAVVQGIVHARGGEITVNSREGHGSVFTVYLPASSQNPVEEAAGVEAGARGGNERVLFVDDEPAIMELGRRLLQKLGYQVEARASGTDALACFSKNPARFDLIVTDMTMPHMQGDQLAREVLAIRPDIPIILCTGYSSQIAAEKAHGIGIQKFLNKPLTADSLAKAVRSVLDEKNRLADPGQSRKSKQAEPPEGR